MKEHRRKLNELERKAGAGDVRIVVVWGDEDVAELEEDEGVTIIRVVYSDD